MVNCNDSNLDKMINSAKTIKETLPNTAKTADSIISTVLGLFDSVILYPLKKINLTFEYKLENFEKDLRKRMEEIPIEYIHDADPSIVGPVLESLKYTYDKKELREMFLNLLTSSMDCRKDTSIHPSYVQLIKQMDSFDANLFKYLASQVGYIKAINPELIIKNTHRGCYNAVPEWYIDLEGSVDIFQTSASLVRLSKLGLIELLRARPIIDADYNSLKDSNLLQNIVEGYSLNYPETNFELEATNSSLYVNDYGKQFAEVCL